MQNIRLSNVPTQELLDFLERNKDYSTDNDEGHRNLVQEIARSSILEIESPFHCFFNVVLRDNSHELGVVDLAITRPQEFYILKAKQTKNPNTNDLIEYKLEIKLLRGQDFFSRNFGVLPILIGAYRIKEEPIILYELEE